MARGPAPKDISLKPGAKKASTRATLFALDPDTLDIPELPPHPCGDEWRPETVAWWEDAWASPMATQYLQSDIHGLHRLACIVDDFFHNPEPGLHYEIHRTQQAYGLSPLDRRRLEWQIETAEAAKDKNNARRRAMGQPAEQPAKADDPRLRIVN